MAGEERKYGNRMTVIAIAMVNVIVQTAMCAIIAGSRPIVIAPHVGSAIA